MARVCQLTGKKAVIGHKVSHSNVKTKRSFDVNLKRKRFFVPETGEWITLRVSTSALKNINKKGISACLKEARAKGLIPSVKKSAKTAAQTTTK
jgi:large subunit ribosomal protein L28